MSYNGAGVFQLAANNPVVTGTTISSTWANQTLGDIANNGLSNCITKDGQQTVVANIPFGGFRAINLANGVSASDAATVGQIQSGAALTLVGIGGTGDAITANATPAITAYTLGQQFVYIPTATNTVSNPTINISTVGAKTIVQSTGASLSPGALAVGTPYEIYYDGTNFRVMSGVLVGATMIVGTVRNLNMLISAASASATLTADQIVVGTSLGGQDYVLTSFNKTVNLATTGAGGMDVGSAPVSGYVALYAIYNPSTGATALLATNCTSSVAPTICNGTMPSGYTASALVSVVATNASSQFSIAYQRDRSIAFPPIQVLSTSVQAASPTALLIAGAVPQNAISCYGGMIVQSSVTASIVATIGASVSGIGSTSSSNAASSVYIYLPFTCPINAAQTIFRTATIGAGTLSNSATISQYTI